MQVPTEYTPGPAVARRRLPAPDALALREALDAELASANLPLRREAIRRACAGARSNGLSAAELILEVKGAWSTLPMSRRLQHADANGIIEAFVSGCIEEFYRS